MTEIGDENDEEEGKTVALDEDTESVKAGRSMPCTGDTEEVRWKDGRQHGDVRTDVSTSPRPSTCSHAHLATWRRTQAARAPMYSGEPGGDGRAE